MRIETGPIAQHVKYIEQRYMRCFDAILESEQRKLSTINKIVFYISGDSMWTRRNIGVIEENYTLRNLNSIPSYVFMCRLEEAFYRVMLRQAKMPTFTAIEHSIKRNTEEFKSIISQLNKLGLTNDKIMKQIDIQFKLDAVKINVVMMERLIYLLMLNRGS